MSLPADIQTRIIRSIRGLEHAEITTFGYCIDYDCVDGTALDTQLQTRILANLYLAGQIAGTTGYEEAAAQGLFVGINAALQLQKKKPLALDRANSYIGVLVDDITRHTHSEPYRMLTSRAEYRLHLRADNADERITPFGIAVGCVSAKRAQLFAKKQQMKQAVLAQLATNPKWKTKARQNRLTVHDISQALPSLRRYPSSLLQNIITDWRYEPYIERQYDDIAAMRHDESLLLPPPNAYANMKELSHESLSTLRRFQTLDTGCGSTPARADASGVDDSDALRQTP